jgi:hypothetical protein
VNFNPFEEIEKKPMKAKFCQVVAFVATARSYLLSKKKQRRTYTHAHAKMRACPRTLISKLKKNTAAGFDQKFDSDFNV